MGRLCHVGRREKKEIEQVAGGRMDPSGPSCLEGASGVPAESCTGENAISQLEIGVCRAG